MVATGLMVLSTFELVHGRDARMYAELELIGVAAAVVSESWLRRPRSWHAPCIGVLVAAGLLTHTSVFLLGAGLVVLAGRRTDRATWRWRIALAASLAVWAVLWGRTFLTQASGGHSDWIPRTTPGGIVHDVGDLVTFVPQLQLAALVVVAAGAYFLVRRERTLGRVWICCALIPVTLAAVTGVFAPVMLDRTLTCFAWAPLLAIGYFVAAIATRARVIGVLVVVVLLAATIPPAVAVVTTRSAPDHVLRQIEKSAAPGDAVAIHPGGRLHELVWSIGVRGRDSFHSIHISGLRNTAGFMLDSRSGTSGRLWLLDWSKHPLHDLPATRCARDWSRGGRAPVLPRDLIEASAGPVRGVGTTPVVARSHAPPSG